MLSKGIINNKSDDIMRALILVIILSMIPLTLVAQAQISKTPQIPLEAYGKLPSKSMVVISPNAQRMAYRDTANNKDIMVVTNLLDGSLLAAIDLSEVKPKSAYFIDDDKLIFTVTENIGVIGFLGTADFSVAYVYNITSKKMHQLLTPGYGIYKGQTQTGRILGISADKKYAYMPAMHNEMSYSLLKVDLERKRKPKFYQRGTSDTIDFFLGNDGEVLARERYNNESDSHFIEARINGQWREIFRQEAAIKYKVFNGVTPDRKNLVMTAYNKKYGRVAYYTMSLADGTISDPLFSHENKDVEGLLKDLNRVVYGVRYSGFTPSYEFFDEKLNARMRGINKAMPEYNIKITNFIPDWQSMVLYMDGDQSSGNYVLYQDGSLNLLATARPDIPAQAVHPVEVYSFNARDGLTIPSLLTTPRDKSAKNLPTILLPHGGPASYDKKGFNWMAQYFASQGYAVIQPQFRGSKGFGVKHLMNGRGQWGRKMQNDLTDAVNDLAKKGTIDKNRVCIVGGSYGGYAALAGAVFTPDLYQCVVSINGVSDIELMLNSIEHNAGSNHWVVSYWQKVIANGNVKEDHLAQISPINHVRNVTAPILLIHGERDKVVPFEQSENMFDELNDADKNVTFIELEEGDHYMSNSKNRMEALKAIDKFIKKYI